MRSLFPTLRNYDVKNFGNDIFSGIIVAFISIPIAIGYAQISGLPAIYGLYGSILPVLIFGALSTSKQFVFGVDAAPAALVGSFIATTGIAFETQGSATWVFIMTILIAVWLFIFAFFKIGNLVEYISTPVMGGFITGIASTVILMQIPKIMGSKSVTGELPELILAIKQAIPNINIYAVVLGLVTLAILLICKKLIPKFPMVIVVMIVSAILQSIFHLDQLGVKMLPGVSFSIPKINLSMIQPAFIRDAVLSSLAIACVIMAQTLLAENNNAMRHGFKIDNNRELYAFSFANLVSALCGSCPLNGSVSRTVLCEQYGANSQMMSVSSSITMLLVVLFGTKYISLLPVPVLTGIIMYALIGVLKIDLAKKLYKVNKKEFYIFMAAFFGVLLFGTIYGVVIGIVLSFANVVIRESNPSRTFLGIIPGMKGFYSLENPNAQPIKNTVIYRFGGNLFFANIKLFQEDIENSIKDDTKCVIVDGRGIGSIDITAAERIEIIYQSLKNKGIKLYLTEHMSELNEQMRKLGIGYIIEEGSARSTIVAALASQGMITKYLLEERKSIRPLMPKIRQHIYSEMEWAFGKEGAHEHFEKYTKEIIQHLSKSDENFSVENLSKNISSWNNFGNFDEIELIENLELHLDEIAERIKKDRSAIAIDLENRKKVIIDYIQKNNPAAYEKILTHIKTVDKLLKDKYPDVYTKLIEEKNKRV